MNIREDSPGRTNRFQRWFVIGLAIWLALTCGLVLVAVWNNPFHRAMLGMGWGLIVLWIGGGGLAMWYWRDFWCGLAGRVGLPWGLKFILGCTGLALLEEAITTTLTNCAPLFGVEVGQAYITASANYFDVVLYHSVVMFVPLFIGWAVILRWWRFSPFAVFVLFGLTGLLAETIAFGPQNLASFALWIFVYGLMVWLPAHWVPEDRPARVPRWWAYPLAVVLPFCFVPLVLVLAPWLWLTPKHPPIHFPPIVGG
ncbi:MAG: hypothetical protein ACYDC1_12585 [Limisphaerales bacterium]